MDNLQWDFRRLANLICMSRVIKLKFNDHVIPIRRTFLTSGEAGEFVHLNLFYTIIINGRNDEEMMLSCVILMSRICSGGGTNNNNINIYNKNNSRYFNRTWEAHSVVWVCELGNRFLCSSSIVFNPCLSVVNPT